MANITESWRSYQPTKGTLVWSFLGGIAATLIMGFAVFNWHTAGGATNLAWTAAEDAQAELASAICIERFMKAPDAAVRLTALKEEGSWSRDNLIEEGGWVTFASMEEPVEGAADLCAAQLVEMEAPEATSTSTPAAPGMTSTPTSAAEQDS